ncbi:glycosyltransferase family 1 protein [Bifidobacterium sp. 82T24]|uniref:glycosyltransferase family 4 protein n=1 Tax=Bifidobacterium pluvialisilvae TaxID=2834436 RepID=UPI001C593121|nr:glycosyltransferase family 1 protein [Bifidobacterium pluvialisilvae]MBW3088422.1 glycosyltransferase family 1 protein [Bifidobacterium pluvialisilvae]
MGGMTDDVEHDEQRTDETHAENGERPLRVLVVSESSLEQTNGVSNSVKHMLRRFRQRDFDAHVISPQPPAESGAFEGYPIDTVTSWPVQNFNVAIPMKTTVIAMIEAGPRPDVIHIAAPISRLGHAALIAGDEMGVPTVAVYQTDVAQYARRFARQTIDGIAGTVAPKHTGWLRKVSKSAGDAAEQILADRMAKLHNKATITLAPTEQARQRLESFGVDPALIRQLGRGVDSQLFNPDRRESERVRQLHDRWSRHGKMPVVGYVGRLAPEKQVDRLSCLMGLGIQLVIVGDGPCGENLRKLMPYAVFTGMLHGDELADAYAALDVFVHTGNQETFGQTIQEAMASRLPVIAPASGGPLDLVDSGRTGLLFSPQNDKALRACVQRVITEDGFRRTIAANGFEAIQGRTWPNVVDRLIDYYRLAMEIRLAHDGAAE